LFKGNECTPTTYVTLIWVLSDKRYKIKCHYCWPRKSNDDILPMVTTRL